MRWTRAINRWLDESDLLDAIFQVAISVFLLASSFAFLALALHVGPEYNPDVHWDSFVAYFGGGELGISVFGVVGIVIYLLFRAPAPISGLTAFLLILILIFAFLPTAILLGSNAGFENDFAGFKLKLILACFVVVNGAWVYAIWKSKQRPPPGQPRADEAQRRARQLAKQARDAE